MDVYVYSTSGFGAQNQTGAGKAVTDAQGNYKIEFKYEQGGDYIVKGFSKDNFPYTGTAEQYLTAGRNPNQDMVANYLSPIKFHLVPIFPRSQITNLVVHYDYI